MQENIFQAVIATDWERTYILFIYGRIDWLPDHVIIGFNAGDGCRYFILPESLTNEAILNLENTSNVGRPGTFIFRADQTAITEINRTGMEL